MRTLWNVISFLAVVHLLALMMLAGWLWQSGRLDLQKVQQLREMLATTAAEDAADTGANTPAGNSPEAAAAGASDIFAASFHDSAARIHQATLVQQREEQLLRRLEQERRTLLQYLESAALRVKEQEAEFQRRMEELEQSLGAEEQRKNDEQFLQTVAYLEQLSPQQVKRLFVAMIDQQQIEQAVVYLNAMNSRAAAKVLKEFKSVDEILLAAELLERVRTIGQQAQSVARRNTAPAGLAAATPSQELDHAGKSARQP